MSGCRRGQWESRRLSLIDVGAATFYKDQRASMPILADLAARANNSPYWQHAVSDAELEKIFGDGLTPLWQGKQTARDVLASLVPQVDALLANDQRSLQSL